MYAGRDRFGARSVMTSSRRILIVEDDEPFRRMLGKQLRLHEEFVSIEADTGVKALELAKADRSTGVACTSWLDERPVLGLIRFLFEPARGEYQHEQTGCGRRCGREFRH